MKPSGRNNYWHSKMPRLPGLFPLNLLLLISVLYVILVFIDAIVEHPVLKPDSVLWDFTLIIPVPHFQHTLKSWIIFSWKWTSRQTSSTLVISQILLVMISLRNSIILFP